MTVADGRKKPIFDYAADRRGEDASQVFDNLFVASLSTAQNKPFKATLEGGHFCLQGWLNVLQMFQFQVFF